MLRSALISADADVLNPVDAQPLHDLVGAAPVELIAVENANAIRESLTSQLDRRDHQAVEGALALPEAAVDVVGAGHGAKATFRFEIASRAVRASPRS